MNAFEWSRLYFRSADRSLHETKATMAALMTYADFDTLTCYPSQRTLAENTGTSVDTVGRHIRKNVDAGWLRKVKQGNSYKQSTEYLLCVPTPRTDAGSSTSGTNQLPAGMQGVPPARVKSTPRTDAGSTPRRDAVLTTHESTQEPPIGGSKENHSDPRGSGGDHLPSIATNHVATPRIGAGSSTGTGAGSDQLASWAPGPLASWSPFDDLPESLRTTTKPSGDYPDPFAN